MFLEIRGIKKSFGSGDSKVDVLRGLDLDIAKGEFCVLLGPSGSGKSTFLRCLNRLEEPTGGQIIFDGTDILDKGTDINKIRQKLGMVFQHFNLFNHLNVMDNLTLAPVKQKLMSEADAKKKAVELLKRVGLEEKAENYPAQLSGGQKQRVAIVRSLMMDPKAILFDEPTSALDVTVQKKILDHLHMLTDSLGTAVLFITHDLGLAAERAQHIVVMYKGQVVESGP